MAAQSEEPSGEIFFLSDGQDYRLEEVGDIMAQAMGVKEILQKNWVCDITKAKRALGFQPNISLLEGAKLTFEWYKKEKWL